MGIIACTERVGLLYLSLVGDYNASDGHGLSFRRVPCQHDSHRLVEPVHDAHHDGLLLRAIGRVTIYIV